MKADVKKQIDELKTDVDGVNKKVDELSKKMDFKDNELKDMMERVI